MIDTREILRHPAVEAYLHEVRLSVAATDPGAADGIIADLTEHIIDAAQDAPDPGAPDVDGILSALGDPALIAREFQRAATSQRPTLEPADAPAGPRWIDGRAASVVTVLVLTFGGFLLPVVGWFIGLVMLWLSRGWRLRDKLIGTIVPPAAILTAAIVGQLVWATPPRLCTEDPTDGITRCTDFVLAVPLLVAAVALGAFVLVSIWLLVTFQPGVAEPDRPAAVTADRAATRGSAILAVLLLTLGTLALPFSLLMLMTARPMGFLLPAFLFCSCWAVGVGMLWRSRGWTILQKWGASLVLPAGFALMALVVAVGWASRLAQSASSSGSTITDVSPDPAIPAMFDVVWSVMLVLLLAGVVQLIVAVWLLVRFRVR